MYYINRVATSLMLITVGALTQNGCTETRKYISGTEVLTVLFNYKAAWFNIWTTLLKCIYYIKCCLDNDNGIIT